MTSVLGIDIGTTSVKVIIVRFNGNDHKVLQKSSLAYHQHVETDEFASLNKDGLGDLIKTGEMNPFLVLSTLICCLEQLDVDFKSKVSAIGVTGMMHGCIYYTRESLKQIRSNGKSFDLNFDRNYQNMLSNVITWEDNRCDKEFLDRLPENSNSANRKAYTGFGTATTFHFLENKPDYLNKYHFMGSIMDFFVHLLCSDLEHPLTSKMIANSLGYFDMRTNNWSTLLDDGKFPKNILPIVLDDNQLAGRLKHPFLGLSKDSAVFVACGDLQSAIYSVQYLTSKVIKHRTAILNSGTSMQLAFTISKDQLKELESLELLDLFSSKVDLPFERKSSVENQNLKIQLEIVPYFQNNYLLTSSSLNGGNVISFFVQSIKKMMTDLFNDIDVSSEEVWSRISDLSKKYIKEKGNELNDEPSICVRLYGERFEEIKSMFSINQITNSNFEIGRMYYSLCSNVLENIFSMCPIELLKRIGIDGICAVGSTITKNEILRFCLEQKLSKENFMLNYEANSEADFGITVSTYENLLNLTA